MKLTEPIKAVDFPRFHTEENRYQHDDVLIKSEHTVRPGALARRPLLQEETTWGLEDKISLESRDSLVLAGKVVGRTSVERRACTKLGGVCCEYGLQVLRGGVGEVVRRNIILGFIIRPVRLGRLELVISSAQKDTHVRLAFARENIVPVIEIMCEMFKSRRRLFTFIIAVAFPSNQSDCYEYDIFRNWDLPVTNGMLATSPLSTNC